MTTDLPLSNAARREDAPGSFLRRHGQTLVALAFWLLLVGGYTWYTRSRDLAPLEAVRQLEGWLRQGLVGPLLFVGLYALRPLLFFPATVLTVLGGYVFGAVGGLLLTIVGSNASSMIAYLVGRYFGRDLLARGEASELVERYAERLRRNSFESVLVMRFLFLPYDLVSYLSGFIRVDWKAFLLATALGALPGTLSFVLFGASVEGELVGGEPSLNPRVLAASLVLFVVSLAISRIVRRREATRETSLS